MKVRLKADCEYEKMTKEGIVVTKEWRELPDSFVIEREMEIEGKEERKKIVIEPKKEKKILRSRKSLSEKLFGKKKHR